VRLSVDDRSAGASLRTPAATGWLGSGAGPRSVITVGTEATVVPVEGLGDCAATFPAGAGTAFDAT
jgi:hypothetical protein